MKKFHYLYKVTHIETGRFYIGIHSTDNIEDRYFANGVYEASDKSQGDWVRLNHGDKPHEGHIKNALIMYGRNAFEREILQWCDTREELILLEEQVVTKEFIESEDNFNHRTGGYANSEFSESVRKKLSENNPMYGKKFEKKFQMHKRNFGLKKSKNFQIKIQ